MSGDEYQGWANRETWAFNLHWLNDQDFYNLVLERARGWFNQETEEGHTPVDVVDRELGDDVIEFVQDELPDLSPELWELLRSDVGSFWRIDHAEVGATVRESLGNEDE